MSKRTKVIIDVDTGIDDAQALLLALRSPALEVIGITTVAGNVNVDQVTANTLKVLDIANAPDIPVAKGFDLPLIENTHYCPQIHGQDGLGNLSLHLAPSTRTVCGMHAVNFLVTTLLSSTEPVTLILLAPLTNIAIALRMEPRIKEKIEKIVMMGGSVLTGGNVTPWAEANMYGDPEAAHIVFTSGLYIVMYGWDVYVKLSYTKMEVDQFLKSQNPWAQFSGKLLNFDIENFKMETACVGDAGAVVAAILPAGLSLQHMHVAVELQGTHTRGMTVADLRQYVFPPDKPKEAPNVHVVVDFDTNLYKHLFRDTLLS